MERCLLMELNLFSVQSTWWKNEIFLLMCLLNKKLTFKAESTFPKEFDEKCKILDLNFSTTKVEDWTFSVNPFPGNWPYQSRNTFFFLEKFHVSFSTFVLLSCHKSVRKELQRFNFSSNICWRFCILSITSENYSPI